MKFIRIIIAQLFIIFFVGCNNIQITSPHNNSFINEPDRIWIEWEDESGNNVTYNIEISTTEEFHKETTIKFEDIIPISSGNNRRIKFSQIANNLNQGQLYLRISRNKGSLFSNNSDIISFFYDKSYLEFIYPSSNITILEGENLNISWEHHDNVTISPRYRLKIYKEGIIIDTIEVTSTSYELENIEKGEYKIEILTLINNEETSISNTSYFKVISGFFPSSKWLLSYNDFHFEDAQNRGYPIFDDFGNIVKRIKFDIDLVPVLIKTGYSNDWISLCSSIGNETEEIESIEENVNDLSDSIYYIARYSEDSNDLIKIDNESTYLFTDIIELENNLLISGASILEDEKTATILSINDNGINEIYFDISDCMDLNNRNIQRIGEEEYRPFFGNYTIPNTLFNSSVIEKMILVEGRTFYILNIIDGPAAILISNGQSPKPEILSEMLIDTVYKITDVFYEESNDCIIATAFVSNKDDQFYYPTLLYFNMDGTLKNYYKFDRGVSNYENTAFLYKNDIIYIGDSDRIDCFTVNSNENFDFLNGINRDNFSIYLYTDEIFQNEKINIISFNYMEIDNGIVVNGIINDSKNNSTWNIGFNENKPNEVLWTKSFPIDYEITLKPEYHVLADHDYLNEYLDNHANNEYEEYFQPYEIEQSWFQNKETWARVGITERFNEKYLYNMGIDIDDLPYERSSIFTNEDFAIYSYSPQSIYGILLRNGNWTFNNLNGQVEIGDSISDIVQILYGHKMSTIDFFDDELKNNLSDFHYDSVLRYSFNHYQDVNFYLLDGRVIAISLFWTAV